MPLAFRHSHRASEYTQGMKRPLTLQGWMRAIVQPDATSDIETVLEESRQHVPVLWLLGKTGAGKSSIVERLTGDSRAEIGNGFEPCTATAAYYDHPAETPVMRFLDTRGLGEAHYEPSDDLSFCSSSSHALLIVTRIDEAEQSALLAAIESLGSAVKGLVMLHVHTALHSIEDPANRQRAIDYNTRQISEAVGRSIPVVEVDFTDPDDGFEDADVGLDILRQAIMDLVPALSDALSKWKAKDAEQAAFLLHRREILGYASAAAAVDVLPAVGLIGVPGIQGKMLHSLALRYGLEWEKTIVSEFLAALGTSFLYRYAVSFMTRQAAKLVPVYGQTAGAAAAATVSFASTYALGRVACLYFHRRRRSEPVSSETLREAFKMAFAEERGRSGAGSNEP